MTCACVELRIWQERGTTDRSQRRMKLEIRNSLATLWPRGVREPIRQEALDSTLTRLSSI
eukprot:scaffold22716_cov82-Cylindrotheca_fusiformis.AAC.3